MSKQTKKPTPGAHAGTARFHTFNAGLAIDLNDATPAIVFHHIYMNIERLVENNMVDADGMAWFTVSKLGIIRFLPEFTKSQIETAINKLTANGLLAKKVSNRKNSYTLTDLGWSYYPMLQEEGKIKAPKAEVKADAEEAKSAEKESNTTKPIDKKAFIVSDTAKTVIDYVNQKAGKHFDYAPSYCKNIDYLVAAGGYTKDQMIAVVDHRYEELSGTKECNELMNPSKLFYIKTFEKFLDDVKKDSEITMTPKQLVQDAKEKQKYHLREAKKCQVERLVLETGACDDNLPFDLITTMTPEEMAKDRRKKEVYHLRQADKFANMAKLMKNSQSVK